MEIAFEGRQDPRFISS